MRLPSVAVIAAAVLALGAGTAPVRAADSNVGQLVAADSNVGQLVMVETKGCAWCAKWHKELGAIYPKTAEGHRLALRVVRLESLPADLRFIADLRYSPTFVAVQCGKEMGRIVGYGSDDMFWGQLGEIVSRLKPGC